MARGIHAKQISIAERCLRLLAVGGRMVYSTCSMSPVEDEAVRLAAHPSSSELTIRALQVVMQLLRWSQGALRLVDCADKLPGFKRRPGLLTWRVMNGEGEWIDSSVTEFTYPSMFPPTQVFGRYWRFAALAHCSSSPL
jgi:multisite-specific tRNA:(cytosine-C5)-methyltransferase